MTKKFKNIAFVLARGQSKRLPKKNIKLLNGKPLIWYAIAAAKFCDSICDVVVSSDCPEILEIVSKINGCIPLKRPEALAMDNSTSEDALRHAVQWYENEHGKIENIILLQPTSPFTTTAMIASCVNMLSEKESVMTVVNPAKKFEWYGKIADDGAFTVFLSEDEAKKFSTCKQFVPSGNVYSVRRDFFLRTNKLKSESHNGTVIVTANEAVDIDYQSDFDYAQFLMDRGEA